MKPTDQIAAEAAEQLFPPTKKRNHRSKAQIRAQAIIKSVIEKAYQEGQNDLEAGLRKVESRAAHASEQRAREWWLSLYPNGAKECYDTKAQAEEAAGDSYPPTIIRVVASRPTPATASEQMQEWIYKNKPL